MKIGILVIATGQYIKYVGSLFGSITSNFLRRGGHHVTFFVFTDQPIGSNRLVRIEQPHLPWPGPTLQRYGIFSRNRAQLEGMDYLYYLDADMVVINTVGDEILGELVGTVHPGFYDKERVRFPYERNPLSTACVQTHEGQHYFAGGFNGGRASTFLGMCDVLAKRIEADAKNGITAVWHDESHLNRYFIDTPPSVVLSPAYCYPQAKWAANLPYRRIIVALDKRHDLVRR